MCQSDLLAYQFKHYGDDSRPLNWFVSAEEATAPLGYEEEGDDGLGYYPDGVKRTLTDEQIAIFRRTELVQLRRERDAAAEAEEELGSIEHEKRLSVPEEDVAGSEPIKEADDESPYEPNEETDNGKRDGLPPPSNPTGKPAMARARQRAQEIPYDQRNKRKWENYIAEVDPAEGAMTHRRLAREMDNQQAENVEMDY